MKYNFDEIIERRGTHSMKWDGAELIKKMGIDADLNEDTMAVYTADMDFQCPQPVIDALHEMIDRQRMFGYTVLEGSDDYYDAIIGWFQRRHDWKIDKESILYVNGTISALDKAIRAYSEDGDSCLITAPVYSSFYKTINSSKRNIAYSSLINNDGYYTMDYEDIEQKTSLPEVKIFLLCSPQNPTGRVWKKEELEKISKICTNNHVILVVDEVHCDIVRKGVTFIPAANVCNSNNTVILNSINKTFNLAGLQCSHAIISNKELREAYKRELGLCLPSPFSVTALVAAYNEGDEWLDQMNEYLDGNIDWALQFLKEKLPKVKCRRPEGTYFLWMDFSEYKLSDEEIVEKIYRKANVILGGGMGFDPVNGQGFQRICLPSPRPIIQEAFKRIEKEFASL